MIISSSSKQWGKWLNSGLSSILHGPKTVFSGAVFVFTHLINILSSYPHPFYPEKYLQAESDASIIGFLALVSVEHAGPVS